MRRPRAAAGLAIAGAVALVVGAGCQLVSGLGDLHVVAVADAGEPLCEAGVSQPCYTGDPQTRGQGACKDGAQVCNATGDAFEACKGQVLPAMEVNCAGAVDLDCDGNLPACHGDLIFTRGFGGPTDDRGLAMSRGKGASSMFAATFTSSVALGMSPIVSVGGTDILTSHLDGAGNPTDPRHFGGIDDDAANALCGDDIDNVILAGRYRGAIDFGDGVTLSNAGDGDAFVTQFDVSSKAIWTLGLGDAGEQEVTAVVSDAGLDVIAVGTLAGSIATSVGTISTSGTADFDGFVIKIGPAGAPLWIHPISDAGHGEQRPLAVAADRSKAVIVGGFGQGDIDFGMGPQPGGGGHDAFLVKYGSDGALAWSHVYGDVADAQSITAVAAASNDDVVIAGAFDGTMTFDKPLIAAGPGRDIFVARVDPAGNPLWSRSFGDATADQAAYAVAVDQFDNVYVGGSFDGVIDLGASQLVSAGGSDAFLIKLDPTGVPLWGRHGGDSAFQQVTGVSVDNFGSPTVVGTFAGTLSFGMPVVSAGGTDIFVARFSP